MQTNGLNAAQDLRRILRLNQPYLEISPCGNLDVAAGQLSCNVSQFAQLKGFESATRDSQPRHEGLFFGTEIEQPTPFKAEEVFFIRRLIARGVVEQTRISIQRVELPFYPLFKNKFLQGCGFLRLRRGFDIGKS